jgi:deoxyribose-phosphate aldolase
MKLKVIFENCYLEDAQKVRLCEICGELGVDWVKTSTGFGTGGATDEDLALMRKHSPAHVQVKAAGGVRDLDRLLHVRALGCSRSGATRTKDILDEVKRRLAAG